MTCGHKIITDHSRLEGDVRIWRCSKCGIEGRWTDGWMYHGSEECLRCGFAVINEVLCPGCAPKDLPVERDDASRAPPKPRPSRRVQAFDRRDQEAAALFKAQRGEVGLQWEELAEEARLLWRDAAEKRRQAERALRKAEAAASRAPMISGGAPSVDAP